MKPRFIVTQTGAYPTPFRVIDLKTRAIVAQGSSEAAARAAADELELRWQEEPTFAKSVRSFFIRLARRIA